ncbi:MAG: hypothetical protein ACFFGP_04845 [Promethearchaeota archaeon]
MKKILWEYKDLWEKVKQVYAEKNIPKGEKIMNFVRNQEKEKILTEAVEESRISLKG